MRPAVFVASVVLLLATPAFASDYESSTQQTAIRPFVGAFLPTGKQKDDLKSSILTGVQVGYPFASSARLVGTFGWAPSKATTLSDAKTNVYQYDVGAELAGHYGSETKLLPFVGLGVGARTYSLPNSTISSQTDVDGFASLGGELTATKLGARLEARDYVSRFKGVDGLQPSSTRNDVMLTGAITFHL